jgi:hypothetical protein
VDPADPTVLADQKALRYFGFTNEPADGRPGKKTKNAIADFQKYVDYPRTGELTDIERGILQSAYQRALDGGAMRYKDITRTQGAKGLLGAMLDEANGPSDPSGTQTTDARTVPPAPSVPAPQPTARQDQTGNGATIGLPPPNETIGLPMVMQGHLSMADYCSEISVLTMANGRTVDPDSIGDPHFALDEQFCAARDYAMARSQQLSAGMPNVSAEVIKTECENLVGRMDAPVALLGRKASGETVASAANLVKSIGGSGTRLVTTGEVCIGYGYKTDNANIVLASAMVLVGSGKAPYAEVFGHHLRRGFGVSENRAAAGDWYASGLKALDQGAEPVFQPSQSAQRSAIIRNSLQALGPVAGKKTNTSLTAP